MLSKQPQILSGHEIVQAPVPPVLQWAALLTTGALPSSALTYPQLETSSRIGAHLVSEQSDTRHIFQLSTARQSSTASPTHSQSDHEQGSRSPSPNSNPPPSPRYNSRCPLSLHLPKRERPSITPISSYVRRKTPQNSPTVLTFAQREYVERPEVIIPPSLPTIPSVSR
ncbi:hypothetical protein K503DRAFT_263054 [Rhizopogon vinicolor AM-OR11-026]|uniref:Uncharacterized protein n=1 Tax=Rhizopogon vinicolor AM-OR11-026 TaxID=1314800 RepID=A0A1B7NDF6_9AGAM|nr:hypothetical protein K503DRAFT_263054 [Rhizopogon vinicolor AM-OR11-026]